MDRRRLGRTEELNLVAELRSVASEAGLQVVGVSRPRKYTETAGFIEERRRLGFFGRMRFTMADPETSCDPGVAMPGVESIITCALCYFADPPPKPFPRAARIAAFARRDFYSQLRDGLEGLADLLRRRGHEAIVLADSNAMTDRPPAVEAGLGRYGKNTMVITYSHGSWVLLGSVLTTAVLPAGSPGVPDCGTCEACMRRCPTGAIVEEGVIDARRCLAYLLQASGDIPEEMRDAVGDRLYGCDDCQICCPLNRSPAGSRAGIRGVALVAKPDPDGEAAPGFWVDPVEVLKANDAELRSRYGHFYVPRRDFDYLRRNALVVLGNCGSAADLATVEPYLRCSREMLRRHARWACERLKGKSGRAPAARDRRGSARREKGSVEAVRGS